MSREYGSACTAMHYAAPSTESILHQSDLALILYRRPREDLIEARVDLRRCHLQAIFPDGDHGQYVVPCMAHIESVVKVINSRN